MKLHLKTSVWTAVALFGILSANQAVANPQIAKANKCFECHSLDKRIIGPTIREIATKYQGQAGAESRLAEKVRKGSVGVWGTTPMQAYPDMPQKDIEAVVRWMLDR
ncbi:MAG: nirM [Burkholderiaceae bacterium]|nr:nirM [Burkholderiaceae bacterium]